MNINKIIKELAERENIPFEHCEANVQNAKEEAVKDLVSGKLSIEDILKEAEKYEDDPILKPFIDELRKHFE